MWESMRFCHIAHSMKRIEILLSHIRNKNKFKNRDTLFPVSQYFKTNFCYIFFQCFKTTVVALPPKTLGLSRIWAPKFICVLGWI